MDGAGEHLLRRHSTKRNYSTMAATSQDAATNDEPSSSLFLPADDHYNNEQATRRPRLDTGGLVLPPLGGRRTRFAGDGFDYRRPVMSSVTPTAAAAPVIDLTDDSQMAESQGSESSGASTGAATAGSSRAQRAPRFGRNIIDIASSDNEDMDEGHAARARARTNGRSQYAGLRRPARPPSPPRGMDDIEFVAERPRSRPQTISRQPTPAAPVGPRSVTPYPTGFEPIDLTADDDVVHLNTRPRDGINAARPGTTAGVGTRSLEERGFGHMGHIADILRGEGANLGGRLMQRLGEFAFPGMNEDLRAQRQAFEQIQAGRGHHHHHHHHHHHREHYDEYGRTVGGLPRMRPMMAMPGMMNYDAPAFDMGLVGANRPPTPKYSPPPEPENGFTRNPAEDEVVVCPNCGDELAMGESDEKQKVWVVKTCGHAYCGTCAQHRLRTVSKKGKGKAIDDTNVPPPFKKCVVQGCGKPTAKNSMIPVFLGS